VGNASLLPTLQSRLRVAEIAGGQGIIVPTSNGWLLSLHRTSAASDVHSVSTPANLPALEAADKGAFHSRTEPSELFRQSAQH
jgi:hypothetical protein